VVGVGAQAVLEPLGIHQRLHPLIHGIEIDIPPGEQRLEALAFLRGFRMQREMDELDLDLEFPLQFFNTPGTEITPGSDVVAEDLKDDRLFRHRFTLLGLTDENAMTARASQSHANPRRQLAHRDPREGAPNATLTPPRATRGRSSMPETRAVP